MPHLMSSYVFSLRGPAVSQEFCLSTGHDESSYCLFLDNPHHFSYLLHESHGPEQGLEQATPYHGSNLNLP